jgi:hypothetical protein
MDFVRNHLAGMSWVVMIYIHLSNGYLGMNKNFRYLL